MTDIVDSTSAVELQTENDVMTPDDVRKAVRQVLNERRSPRLRWLIISAAVFTVLLLGATFGGVVCAVRMLGHQRVHDGVLRDEKYNAPVRTQQHLETLTLADIEMAQLERFEQVAFLVLQTSEEDKAFYRVESVRRSEPKTDTTTGVTGTTTLLLAGGDSLTVVHGKSRAVLEREDGSVVFDWSESKSVSENETSVRITYIPAGSVSESTDTNTNRRLGGKKKQMDGAIPGVPQVDVTGMSQDELNALAYNIAVTQHGQVKTGTLYGSGAGAGGSYTCTSYPCMGMIGVAYPYPPYVRPYPVFGYGAPGFGVTIGAPGGYGQV